MDRSFGPAVFVEVCAGSATLSAEAMKTGFQVFPIDYGKNRFRAKASIFLLDLSETSSVGVIQHIIRFCKPDHAHFGLPCGTCSRARDLPVKRTLRMQGAPEPRPLRSGDKALGLPGLDSPKIRTRKGVRVVHGARKLCEVSVVVGSNSILQRSIIYPLAGMLKQQEHACVRPRARKNNKKAVGVCAAFWIVYIYIYKRKIYIYTSPYAYKHI